MIKKIMMNLIIFSFSTLFYEIKIMTSHGLKELAANLQHMRSFCEPNTHLFHNLNPSILFLLEHIGFLLPH